MPYTWSKSLPKGSAPDIIWYLTACRPSLYVLIVYPTTEIWLIYNRDFWLCALWNEFCFVTLTAGRFGGTYHLHLQDQKNLCTKLTQEGGKISMLASLFERDMLPLKHQVHSELYGVTYSSAWEHKIRDDLIGYRWRPFLEKSKIGQIPGKNLN
jgi:hypothetical protein